MKIAFVSCIHAGVFPGQPVWDWIGLQQPDHLVLLGDSIYLDVASGASHPRDLSDPEFAELLFCLYEAQLAQPEFRKLVASMPPTSVWSIWDDHDFLWNDACGEEMAKSPVHREKIRLATAFQEAFRRALSKNVAVGSFPHRSTDPVFWQDNQPPLSTPIIDLAPDVHLYLTDGRTYRSRTWLLGESKRQLLGVTQREALARAMTACQPSDVHLIASGSTVGDYKKGYPADWAWLTKVAADQRCLVFSGDIHRNETDAFFTPGFPLHEATSSGAAIKDAVVIGKARRNFGLLTINPDELLIQLFAGGKEEAALQRRLSRATWLPI